MKKKMLSVCMCLVLAGCGNATTTEPTETVKESVQSTVIETKEVVEQETKTEVKEETTETFVEQVIEEKEYSLESLASYLIENGVVNDEPIQMAASMVKAEDGIKFKEPCKVEIYKYDTESEEYSVIYESKKVELEGFNMEIEYSAIVDGYAILLEEENQSILDCFMNYFN